MKPIKFNLEANMNILNRFKAISFFLIAAYLLAACGGTLPSSTTSSQGPKGAAAPVAFTGIVEAINDSQWTVSGQPLTLDPQVSIDPNISVGDAVKVEAKVSADGSVVAMKVESSVKDDSAATSSDDVSTPTPIESVSADVSATQATGNPSVSSSQAGNSAQNEVFGTVEAITADTITIDGVVYNLAQGFTEIKDPLTVGDQVKLHLIVNADGTFTVREIEKSVATVDDHSNSNGSNDGPNHDVNDDKSSKAGNEADDGTNHNSNDDHGGNSGSGGG
jgi:hypothetical protein